MSRNHTEDMKTANETSQLVPLILDETQQRFTSWE